MNRKGFTLVELLAVLIILGIVFTIAFNLFKGTFSLVQDSMSGINDNQVFEAARNYVFEINKPYNNYGYVCVDLKELIDYGYIDNSNYQDKMIKITRNTNTLVIENIEYVDVCE